MHIVHVQHPYIPEMGYQENHLPPRQQDLGYNVDMVTTTHVPIKEGTNRTYREFEPGTYDYKGVKTHRLNCWLQRDSGKVIIWGLLDRLKELSPDIVHLHGLLDYKTLQTVRFTDSYNIPLFVDVHIDNGNLSLSKLQNRVAFSAFQYLLLDWIVTRTNLFLPVNPLACEFLTETLDIPSSQVELLPIGIDNQFEPDEEIRKKYRERLGFDSEDFVIIDSGKFDETKDTDILIEAFAAVYEHHQNVRLLLVGDGPEEYIDRLKMIADEHGVWDRIILTGWVDYEEVPNYYNAGDLGVMPGKLSSGKDMIGVGLPLIVAHSSATEYLVTNDNGATFIRGNIDVLADRISEFLENEELYKTAQKNALKVGNSKLSWEAVAEKSIELYRQHK